MDQMKTRSLRRAAATIVLTLVVVFATHISKGKATESTNERGSPVLWRKVRVPENLLSDGGYAGDVRVGDLDRDGEIEFVVFRSADKGMKPCFIGAFDLDGRTLWRDGDGGRQPARPGPVAVCDLDGDRAAEVLCFFLNASVQAEANSMENVVVQVRDGKTGAVLRQAAPRTLRKCTGEGPNWVHHRLIIANLRGEEQPRDFIVKLGGKLLALSSDLKVLWTYDIAWNAYSRCSAYIPAVGDIDSDGKDEVNGGFYLLDDNGAELWAGQIARHMDSVAIAPWDNGQMRAICSGYGHVLDRNGRVIMRLGQSAVPHGQEVRVADFDDTLPGVEMIIRYNGHNPDAMLVDNEGHIVRRFRLNESPNNTGMEAVLWNGPGGPALLYNGGMLWTARGETYARFEELGPPVGEEKMGWFHCIAGNVCSDEREEVVLYNPWDRWVWIYTPAPLDEGAFRGFTAGPRQYNPRLMD